MNQSPGIGVENATTGYREEFGMMKAAEAEAGLESWL